MSGTAGYVEVVKAQTNGRKCHKCAEKIARDSMYLHMERNRHVYCICGKCMVIFTKILLESDPTFKADAAAQIL